MFKLYNFDFTEYMPLHVLETFKIISVVGPIYEVPFCEHALLRCSLITYEASLTRLNICLAVGFVLRIRVPFPDSAV